MVIRKVRHSTVSLHRVRLLFSLFSAFHVYSVYIMDESKVREILVSSSISDLKRSSDANSAEQMLEIKRLKRDAPPSFNKKCNEDQYKATVATRDCEFYSCSLFFHVLRCVKLV